MTQEYDEMYFPQIYNIWTQYEKKKIGLQKRDKLLEPHRTELYQTKVNNPHALPTRTLKTTKQPKMTHDELAQLTADWYGVPVEEIE